MQTKRFTSSQLGGLALLCAWLVCGTALAQDSSGVSQAFQTARKAVSSDIQGRVVSVYGIGTPNAIQKWYIIFYDPKVPSHGRAVLVENDQVTKTYEARGGTTYSSALTFDPSRISSETAPLAVAQKYAADHNIAYDSVRALLKQTSVDKPFRWRIELLSGANSHGYVFVNALDDTFALYSTAASTTGEKSSGKSSDSSDNSAKGFANKVQNTFLGIGGDLEEFFTGERTVDR
jgi:hypothetical protein